RNSILGSELRKCLPSFKYRHATKATSPNPPVAIDVDTAHVRTNGVFGLVVMLDGIIRKMIQADIRAHPDIPVIRDNRVPDRAHLQFWPLPPFRTIVRPYTFWTKRADHTVAIPQPRDRSLRTNHSLGLVTTHTIHAVPGDRKSTRLNSSHVKISYAVFCSKKKRKCCWMSRARVFDVAMISVSLKFTIRPLSRVRCPSSSTCASVVNSSGCALSVYCRSEEP